MKLLFSFRSLSKSSVDVTGTPLTSGRPLPRESDGSVALQILVPAAVERHAFATHQHIHTYTHNHSRAHEHARAHTQIPSERERHTHTCQPPGRSSDRGVDSKGLRSSGCKTSSTATRVAGSKRTPGSQQRLQDIIYHHSGCREPAVIYRRPMLPGFGIHLDVGDSGVQFGAGQMSAAGLHAALKVQVRAARHRAGLACIGTSVQRALDSWRESK